MKLTILALGTRMPDWVERGVAEYSKRFPPEIRLELRELPIGARGRDSNTAQAVARETESILKALPSRDKLVVLDVAGRSFSTEQLAASLADWQMSGDNYSLVIGGPDGVDDSLLQRADLRWSLSPLTLPHPLVRILLVEQLYRAWTINAGHPYHRS
jgi:23S rRNA (pseudouridine1915-N3)-methyltransferase